VGVRFSKRESHRTALNRNSVLLKSFLHMCSVCAQPANGKQRSESARMERRFARGELAPQGALWFG
jgi:hypothetical protein